LDLFSKALALFGRIHRMEAAPVKHEAKWRSVNTFALAALSMAFSIASSELSTPTTSKVFCESQIALSPVPHPISSALQGSIGVVVTV
jgi:hypothetical protein